MAVGLIIQFSGTLDPALRALARAYEYEDWPRGPLRAVRMGPVVGTGEPRKGGL
jgi:hypothetical protein